jgi:SET domain-containing protein
MKILPSQKIFIADSKIPKAGRGVFAIAPIKKGETVERCPVLILPKKDYPIAKKTELRNYYFMWGKTTSVICFGYGSFYNHSYYPNATYQKKTKEQIIEFVAIKDIGKEEEITVNYNYGKPDDKNPLWIKAIKPAE